MENKETRNNEVKNNEMKGNTPAVCREHKNVKYKCRAKAAVKITALAAAAAMSASAVLISGGTGPVPVMAAEHSAAKKNYVTSDVLNVRSGPDTDCSVIGTLTRGMRVKVYSIRGEKGNRWARIRFQGVTAYVSAGYLAKTAS